MSAIVTPSTATQRAAASLRLPWIDWQRGLVVLAMIEVHAVDSWLAPPASAPTLRAIGGMAAPGFLYLSGLSQVLADEAQARRGVPAAARRRGAVQRALWLVGVAYVFRVVEYLLGGAFLVPGGWRGILKVDILNCIGVSLLVGAVLVVGRSRRFGIAAASVAALLMTALAPVVAAWPPEALLGGYVYSEAFGLCAWAAFAWLGNAVGAWMVVSGRTSPGWVLGAGLAAAGYAFEASGLRYGGFHYWRTSPAWVLLRAGIALSISALLAALPARVEPWLAPLRRLGAHSLIIYMVTVELSYGIATKLVRHRLDLAGVWVGIALLTLGSWELARRLDRRAARAAT